MRLRVASRCERTRSEEPQKEFKGTPNRAGRTQRVAVAFCLFVTLAFAASTDAQAQGIVTQQTGARQSITAEGVPRAECFPFERLSAAERAKAEELLLRALDSEALYTIVGAIKPMSSGFGLKKFSLRAIDLAQLEERRRILAQLRCGEDFAAYLHHFARTFNGERSFDSVVINLPLLREMLAERQPFFRRWGITPNADVMEVLLTIEYDETSARNVGYGYLFGYPDYAVNFFGEAVDLEERTGTFVERDFISIPTFVGERRFVYAVPRVQGARG